MNRRKFLKIAGSASIIVAAGGIGFVMTRTPTRALQPWKDAGTLYSDPMRKALSYAILAPNPHNRQPWVVDLKSETEAVLTCDLERQLPGTDPFSRQIVIGLGCFLELFALAAAEQGYRAHITYFPEGAENDKLDNRPIAHLSLEKQDDLKGDPLFAYVLDRHTNREPYDTSKVIANHVVKSLHDAPRGGVTVGTVNNGKLLNELRVLTKEGMFTELKTPHTYQESIDLMRIGKAEIEANPDGIALGGAFLEALSLVGVLTKQSLADPKSNTFQVGLDMAADGAMSSMGFVWINTNINDRKAQIEAGRAYMRVSLQAKASGLSMQPMSQTLQEYSEMAPSYQIVHDKLTDKPGERVQMLARLGYAKDVGPAPRWPLETRLKGS